MIYPVRKIMAGSYVRYIVRFGRRVLDTKFQVLDAKSRVLDAKSRVLDAKSRVLDARCGIFSSAYRLRKRSQGGAA